MLVDDVTTVALTPEGHAEVLPGAATMRLTDAAVNGLGYQLGLASRGRYLKARIATGDQMAPGSARLGSIYELRTHAGRDVRVQELSGVEKFGALQACIHGPMLADEHPQVFPIAEAIVRSTAIYRLERPSSGWTVDQVAEAVLGLGGVS